MLHSSLLDRVLERLDRRFLIDALAELIKVPTEVPLGPDTLIAPDHPKLVHYVQNVVRPMMRHAGIHNIMEMPLNQIVVRAGLGESPEALLLEAYTPSQHHNFTKEPFTPRIAIPYEHGIDEPCIFGQGISQNKVHLAAAMTVLKALVETGDELRGTLYFALNNEGRSSHACSEAIIPRLNPKPRYGIVLIGTGFAISAGNRGRVDVYVHVHGEPTHSSTPWKGLSAILGANEVINRVNAMRFTKTHPLLGGQHAVPYQVVYEPVAPHTLPGYPRITIDRRLLPNDDIDQAVDEIRQAIGDMSPFRVVVEKGVYMLPALVDIESPLVKRLSESTLYATGKQPPLQYQPGSFDAGGLCQMGVETVMWGASGGVGLLGDDFVALSDAWNEALALTHLICNWLC